MCPPKEKRRLYDMNTKIYVGTIIISLMLIMPVYVYDCVITTVLSSIGCSGIAAAIMAIFLEISAKKREKVQKDKSKSIYFQELKEQLKMMLERILWFDERMDDDFDWNKDLTTYCSFKYMIYASHNYPSNEQISFKEAESRLNALEAKYSLEEQEKMDTDQLQKVQKMFSILAISGLTLLSVANSIKENRIVLDTEDYISLKDNENIHFNIYLAISLMRKPKKNYGAAIKSILCAYKSICKIGNYTDDLTIGLHSTIAMDEI